MATKDVADGLVSLCKRGQFDEAMARYYADSIVSVEPMGEPAEAHGLAAVRAKAQSFNDSHQIHSVEVDGPYLNGDQFAVRFTIDVTPKATNQRFVGAEVGVYTVAGDKVVRECFFSGPLG